MRKRIESHYTFSCHVMVRAGLNLNTWIGANVLLLFMLAFGLRLHAQDVWTVERCVSYAVAHNHDVRMRDMAVEDYKTEKTRQAASFLPYIGASVNGQFNFGRAIDPGTNTYTNVSTFSNGYGISASIPVFDGLQRYTSLRIAKVNLLLGRQGVLAQKDATARMVLESYMQVLYYKGTVEIAAQKRAESEMLLRQTMAMAEVGTKGDADVAQMQTTYASDDYEVTHQQGLYDNAMLELKRQMNYPMDSVLDIVDMDTDDILCEVPSEERDEEIFMQARLFNPDLKMAEYTLKTARYSFQQSKRFFLPSISIGAGVSTSYYKQMGNHGTRSFSEQFRNNSGQYVSASLLLPIFSRLDNVLNIRRQRNNVRRAEENLRYQNDELRRLIRQALTDVENSRKDADKMRRKVESDSIASRLVIRKYEEGLASPIDVQTQGTALLQSKAQLLQSRLSYAYKTRIVNYYKGTPLWTE